MDAIPQIFANSVIAQLGSYHIERIRGETHPQNFTAAARRILERRLRCHIRLLIDERGDVTFHAKFSQFTSLNPEESTIVEWPAPHNHIGTAILSVDRSGHPEGVIVSPEMVLRLLRGARALWLDLKNDAARKLTKFAIANPRIVKSLDYLMIPHDFECPAVLQLLNAVADSGSLRYSRVGRQGDLARGEELLPIEHHNALLKLFAQPQFKTLKIDVNNEKWSRFLLLVLIRKHINDVEFGGKSFHFRGAPPFHLFDDFKVKRLECSSTTKRSFVAWHKENGVAVLLNVRVNADPETTTDYGSLKDTEFFAITQTTEVRFCDGKYCDQSCTTSAGNSFLSSHLPTILLGGAFLAIAIPIILRRAS